MKKFLIIAFSVIAAYMLFDYLYFYQGVLYLPHHGEVSYFSMVSGDELYIETESGFEPFVVQGVNMGLGKPGHYAEEHAITKEEYLRWFQQMQEMGANVLRVYTLGPSDFYEAFYEYNINNPEPLYLIHGVWVDEYLINSSYCALDEEFYEPFMKDCKMIVDVIHGRYKYGFNEKILPEYYNKDISQWVYGYIVGIEWESHLVTYTDHSFDQLEEYEGTYLYTEDASNFEIFLASIGDEMIRYEVDKYGTQRTLAFSNWATTDPLEHETEVEVYFQKVAKVDVEHIKCTDAFASGQFASYHIYPYYPDYYALLEEHEENTYLQYLKDINEHHTMPVIISEFGIPSSRGVASTEDSYGRNQGGMSEKEQGEALVSLYKDIMEAGSNGGIVFTWQDEWFKRTWNTMAATNLNATPYWSDYQTNEQYFGLLSFDPGEEESICYVDGDLSEWADAIPVAEYEDMRLYMKYDEKFIYFMVEKDDFSIETDVLYIPIDTTENSGSKWAENLELSMTEAADFVIEIQGKDDSRVWVHQYYDIMSALFYGESSSQNFFSKEFPKPDTTEFVKIQLLYQKDLYYMTDTLGGEMKETDVEISYSEYDSANPYHYTIMGSTETGKLTYGNANPSDEAFDSLADFCASDNGVEIKLPWLLLNIADPSNMYIHDDYYEHFGVEYMKIGSVRVGVGTGDKTIEMKDFALKPLGRNPKYHERLKESYYILKEYWTNTTP